MAKLRYNQVQGPNFSGVGQAMQASQGSWNAGFNAIGAGLDDAIDTRKTTASNKAMQELAGVVSEDQVASTLAGLGIDPKDITADAMAAIMGSQGRAMGFDSERLTQEGTRASTRGTNARTAATNSRAAMASTEFDQAQAERTQLNNMAGTIANAQITASNGGFTNPGDESPTGMQLQPDGSIGRGSSASTGGQTRVLGEEGRGYLPENFFGEQFNGSGNNVNYQSLINIADGFSTALDTGNKNRDTDRLNDNTERRTETTARREDTAEDTASQRADIEREKVIWQDVFNQSITESVNAEAFNYFNADAFKNAVNKDPNISAAVRTKSLTAIDALPAGIFETGSVESTLPEGLLVQGKVIAEQDRAFGDSNELMRIINQGAKMGESDDSVIDLINNNGLDMTPGEVLDDVAKLRGELGQDGVNASNEELMVILRDNLYTSGYGSFMPGGHDVGDIRFDTDKAIAAAKEYYNNDARALAIESEANITSRSEELAENISAVQELERQHALTLQRGGEVSMASKGQLNRASIKLEEYITGRPSLQTPTTPLQDVFTPSVNPLPSNLFLGNPNDQSDRSNDLVAAVNNTVTTPDPTAPDENNPINNNDAIEYLGRISERELEFLKSPRGSMEDKLSIIEDTIYQVRIDATLDPIAKQAIEIQLSNMAEALNNTR